MLEGARGQGIPESAVQYLALLYAAVRRGAITRVTDDVRKVTGKAPVSFEEFARLTPVSGV